MTPDPLAGRLSSVPAAFLLLSLAPSIDREELVRESFWTPAFCVVVFGTWVVLLLTVLFASFASFTSFRSTASFLATLLTSPRAARFLCSGAVLVVETMVEDFFVASGFLTGTPVASSGPANAAALARVNLVVPLFSSFSLLTARCRIERA